MPANHVLSVRLPLDVFERLAALAAREHRSINAQLVHMIERGTPEMSTPTNPTTDFPLPTDWEGKAHRIIVTTNTDDLGRDIEHGAWILDQAIEGYCAAGQMWIDGDYESCQPAPSWAWRDEA